MTQTYGIVTYPALIKKLLCSWKIVYMLVFIVGYLYARYNLFVLYDNKLNQHPSILMIICVLIREILAKQMIDATIDIVLIAPFVWAFLIILNNSYLEKLLLYLGRYSTYIWLTHTVFILYFAKDFIHILPNISLLVYIAVLLISLLVSIVLSKIENKLMK